MLVLMIRMISESKKNSATEEIALDVDHDFSVDDVHVGYTVH